MGTPLEQRASQPSDGDRRDQRVWMWEATAVQKWETEFTTQVVKIVKALGYLDDIINIIAKTMLKP